jgi:hypothetical protein
MSSEDRRSLGGALGGVLSPVVTLPGVKLRLDKEVDSPRPGLCPVRGVRSWLSMTPNNKGGVTGLLNAMACCPGLNLGYALVCPSARGWTPAAVTSLFTGWWIQSNRDWYRGGWRVLVSSAGLKGGKITRCY